MKKNLIPLENIICIKAKLNNTFKSIKINNYYYLWYTNRCSKLYKQGIEQRRTVSTSAAFQQEFQAAAFIFSIKNVILSFTYFLTTMVRLDFSFLNNKDSSSSIDLRNSKRSNRFTNPMLIELTGTNENICKLHFFHQTY